MPSIQWSNISALFLAASLLCTPFQVSADQAEDINQLLVQGHFWYERGRPDLAKAAWRKVLLVEPQNPEALAGLGELGSLKLDNLDREKLRLARELARQKRYAEALILYQQAFSGAPPTSYYSSEYFLTLAGTAEGTRAAHEGIAKLVNTYPSNRKYGFALAKVKTFIDENRTEGIQMLRSYLNDPEFDEEADEAWKQALLWLSTEPSNKPLFEEYLQAHPGDTQIQTKLDVVVFVELGILKLRQQRFTEASRYLRRAIEIAPGKRKGLQAPLADATFWSFYKRAEWAHNKGRMETALKLVKRAQAQRPRNINALLLRAQIEAKHGDLMVAEQTYRDILDRESGHTVAQNGLIALLINTRREAEAEAVIARYGITNAAYTQVINRYKASSLRNQASKSNDPQEAIQLLEQAKSYHPENSWIRLDLAKLYRAQNRKAEAHVLLDDLLGLYPDNYDAHFAKALFYAEEQEWSLGMLAIEAIPAMRKTKEQNALHQHLWGNHKQQIARKLLDRNDKDAVHAIVKELQENENNNPELMLIRAELLAELGERDEAIALATKALQLNDTEDVDLNIRYATVLLKTQQLGILREHVAALKQNSKKFTRTQALAMDDLELGLVIQSADALRKEGKLPEAYAELEPMLDRHGENSDVKLALANIYRDRKDYDRALKLYQEAADSNSGSVDAWTGAVGTAMAQRNFSMAHSLADQALSSNPDAPRLRALRGQLNWMKGDHNAAFADLKQALELDQVKPRLQWPAEEPVQQKQIPGVKLAQTQTDWRETTRTILSQIEENRLSVLTAGVAGRFRKGDDGFDELTEYSLPIQVRIGQDYESQWGFEAYPVTIDAGTFEADLSSVGRFGTLGLDRAAFIDQSFNQDKDGVAVSGFYTGKNWTFDLGSTPLGFNQENIVGGLSWQYKGHDRQFSLELSQRAVKETLLSYSGTKDPRTGLDWGGVTRMGVQLNFDRGYGLYGIYGQMGYYGLEGKNVKDNNELVGQIGFYRRLIDESNRSLNLGLNLSYRSFDENLRFFTFGHGGYFSPKQYVSLTVPISYEKHEGRLSYRVSARAGVQHFEEDDVDVYPNNPSLQQQLETIAARVPGTVVIRFEGKNETDFVYNLRGRLEYAIDKKLVAGGFLSAANTDDYREITGGLYLKYFFSPRMHLYLNRLTNKISTYNEMW